MRLRLAQAGYQILGAPLTGGAALCSPHGAPGGSGVENTALTQGYTLFAPVLCRRVRRNHLSAPEQAEHGVGGRAAGITTERPRYRGQITFQERDLLAAAEQAQELGSQALGPHLAL